MGTTLAVDSEVEITETLNEKRRLYHAESKHEERLLRCVKDLAKFVAGKEQVDFDEEYWLGFHAWVNMPVNQAKATGYANAFVSKYLKEKGDAVSAGHTLQLYLGIWRRWGISVSETVKEQINTFKKEVWKPNKVSRQSTSRSAKVQQFDSVEPVWSTMVEYLLGTSAADFRAHLRAVVNNRLDHEGIAETSFQEMITVANKSDEGLLAVMRCSLAYASLLRSTGMRSITGLDLTLNDYGEQAEGEVLLTRVEHKVCSVRNVDKTVYAKVVPNKEPSQCTLVHLARFFAQEPGLPDRPFTLGFTSRKHGKRRTDSSKPVQVRFIAVLHAVAIACGLPNGLSGDKKLHLFRVMSENILATRGATPRAREDFIGWTNSVQSANYSVLRLRAKQSNCAYLLAGRDSHEDPPHAMWQLLGDVPGSEGQSYWQRVVYLAVAAGVCKDSTVAVDGDFQMQMDEHLKAAAKRSATSTDPAALNKRIRELERELQNERTKRAKLEVLQALDSPPDDASETASATSNSSSEPEPVVEPVQALRELVLHLKANRNIDDFPRQCAQALPQLSRLIDAACSPQRTFALTQASADGKDLVRILYLAALRKRCTSPNKGTARSWFGLVNNEKKHHAVLKEINMGSWATYRASSAAG
jgi:hypothetical protein